MSTYFVTFSVGGPLRNQYAKFEAESEKDVRLFCKDHFPRDWSFVYLPKDFEDQAEKFGLRLCFEETL